MKDLLSIVFRSGWTFAGTMALLLVVQYPLYLLAEVMVRCVSRLVRRSNIRHHGWPPLHCDADGDPREGKK